MSDPRRVDTVGAEAKNLYLKENTPRDNVLLLGLGGGRGVSSGRQSLTVLELQAFLCPCEKICSDTVSARGDFPGSPSLPHHSPLLGSS